MHFSSVAFPRAELRSERQGAYKSCILRGLRPICPRMHAHARPAQDLAEEPAHTHSAAEPLDGRLAHLVAILVLVAHDAEDGRIGLGREGGEERLLDDLRLREA
jgi:hypothetical protein